MNTRPKIAFMTTLGTNVGDDFIRAGIFSFFSEVFGKFEPLYVNKHDLSTLFRWCEGESVLVPDKFRYADIIVQAGTPVYWNLGESTCYNVSWANALWEDRIFRLGHEKPIFNIGAGSCQPYPGAIEEVVGDPKCVSFIRSAHMACCWTSVRDPLASEILSSLGLNHASLPCPAFHAARSHGVWHGTEKLLAVNFMRLGGHFKLKQDITTEYWAGIIEELVPELRKYHRLIFVAHDMNEKEFMERWRCGSEIIFYSSDWRDYLRVYASCIGAVTNRVHGAVCAAGFGRPSVIVGNDSRLLIGDFIGIPSLYVGDTCADEIVELVERGLQNAGSERERLISLREETARRYCSAIEKGVADFSLDKRGGRAKFVMQDGMSLKKKQNRRSEFKNILLPRFDTFGDIVLLEGFVKNLMDLFPNANITLLVREGYDQLAPMFPDGLEWLTTSINPYKDRIDKEIVNSLLEKLRKRNYDLILITTYDRTWLDEVLAAALSPAKRFMLGGRPEPVPHLKEILDHLEIRLNGALYDAFFKVEEKTHETDKYQLFFAWLRGREDVLPRPRLHVPGDVSSKAGKLLSTFGLRAQDFIFCFPAGTATVRSKVWGADNFAQVIGHIERKYSIRALVAGHENEKEIVEEVVESAKQRGTNPEFWLGKDGDIPLACALVEKSFFYLGNDTGLMHMAAALNKPVFAIFGGGTWPRFLPRAEKGRAFVCPMPCFYCKWDCFFDEPLCLNSIPVEPVIREIDKALMKGFVRGDELKIIKIPHRTKEVKYALQNAAQSLRRLKSERDCLDSQVKQLTRLLKESEADRETRLAQTRELQRLLRESEADRAARLELIKELSKRLDESERDRAARLTQIEELGRRLEEVEADRAARLELIEELEGRLEEVEADRAARLQVIEGLVDEIDELKAELKDKSRIIEEQRFVLDKKPVRILRRLKAI